MVSNIFYFHPYLGKWSVLTNSFQMGWNHQLVLDLFHKFAVNGGIPVFCLKCKEREDLRILVSLCKLVWLLCTLQYIMISNYYIFLLLLLYTMIMHVMTAYCYYHYYHSHDSCSNCFFRLKTYFLFKKQCCVRVSRTKNSKDFGFGDTWDPGNT